MEREGVTEQASPSPCRSDGPVFGRLVIFAFVRHRGRPLERLIPTTRPTTAVVWPGSGGGLDAGPPCTFRSEITWASREMISARRARRKSGCDRSSSTWADTIRPHALVGGASTASRPEGGSYSLRIALNCEFSIARSVISRSSASTCWRAVMSVAGASCQVEVATPHSPTARTGRSPTWRQRRSADWSGGGGFGYEAARWFGRHILAHRRSRRRHRHPIGNCRPALLGRWTD